MEHDDDLPHGEEYPSAPIPPHERVWRHPSEVGSSQWTATEPPLALGRGLMVATGVVGVLLAGGLVWAMLPSGGPTVTASSSTLSLALASSTSEAPVTTLPPQGTAPVTTPPSNAPVTSPATTVPPPAVPVVVLADDPTAMATSVVVGEQVFLITTLAAIGDRQRVQVVGNDGASTDASLVWSDASAGLAVLAAPTADIAGSVGTANLPDPGTGVQVVSTSGLVGASLTVAPDGSTVLDGVAPESVAEGSPVLDPDGRMVGVCTGSKVVPVQLPAAVRDLLAKLRGWVGISLAGSDDDAPVLVGLEPGGPADEAGLLDGDQILSIDGFPIDSIGELQWTIARHLPGDTITVEVLRAGTPLPGLVIELAPRPTSL
jgi:S1-C subfamily serine protease